MTAASEQPERATPTTSSASFESPRIKSDLITADWMKQEHRLATVEQRQVA